MKKDLFSCLHYYEFDKELWTPIRTANMLERAFREVRRLKRPMNNFFSNEASSNWIIYGTSKILNKHWRGNLKSNFHKLMDIPMKVYKELFQR